MDWDYSVSDTNNYLQMTVDLSWPQQAQKTPCLTPTRVLIGLCVSIKNIIIFTKKKPTIDTISRLLLTTALYHSPKLDKAQKLLKPQTDARISIESDNSSIIICRCVCHHCSNKCLFWNKISVVVLCMGLTRSLTGVRGLCYCM